MKRVLLALVAFAGLVVAAPAEPLAAYVWVDVGDQIDLVSNNVQVGAINGAGYRPLVGGVWGEVCDPPVPPPVPCRFIVPCRCQVGGGCKCNHGCKCGKKADNFGIDRDRLHTTERFSVNGREISRDEADGIIGGPSLPDDAQKPWIVYSAKDEADAAQAREQLKPYAERWRTFVCKSSDWYVKDRDGKPVFAEGLTVLTPDGRQARVENFEALRQVPPDFDPAKVPLIGPNAPKPSPCPGPGPCPSPEPTPTPAPSSPPSWPALAVLGVLGLSLLKKKG